MAPIPIASKEMDYNGTCLASGYGRTSHTEKVLICTLTSSRIEAAFSWNSTRFLMKILRIRVLTVLRNLAGVWKMLEVTLFASYV